MRAFLKGRLISLDVFRGVTIGLMILVNNPGGDTYYSALQHADWNGWTLADLVFPFFLFIVGVAISYSLANRLARGDSKRRILLRVVYRSAILFLLGLLINSFPSFDLSTIRVMGVLQRIALCYLLASLIFLTFKNGGRVFFTVSLPLVYWLSMTIIPVPGYGAGILGKEGNLAQYIDSIVLGNHNYRWNGTWDPEGILSTLPAVATTLIGILAGEHLKSNRSPSKKTINLFLFGVFCVGIGILWGNYFPINKNLWTSSYVALTGGLALIFLAVGYYIIDVKEYVRWTKPFIILGTNSITIFILSEAVNLALIYTNITVADGTSVALKSFIYKNYFASWAGALNGSLFYSLTYLMLWLGITSLLYKLRMLIKI